MKTFFGKLKAYQARGGAWMQLIMTFGIVTANIALFKDYLAYYGIDVLHAIVFAGVLYICGTILVGFLDAKYGVWGNELAINSNLNPVIRGISEDVKEIKGKLK
jgi:hypothetical protein